MTKDGKHKIRVKGLTAFPVCQFWSQRSRSSKRTSTRTCHLQAIRAEAVCEPVRIVYNSGNKARWHQILCTHLSRWVHPKTRLLESHCVSFFFPDWLLHLIYFRTYGRQNQSICNMPIIFIISIFVNPLCPLWHHWNITALAIT